MKQTEMKPVMKPEMKLEMKSENWTETPTETPTEKSHGILTIATGCCYHLKPP